MKKIVLAGLLMLASLWVVVTSVHADTITDNGLAFLQTKQDSAGKISGYGGESQWAAIAFAASGVDVATVKNPSVSLKDYLLSDKPASGSAATEWERRILAIVAIGDDPSNFSGVNYVQNLESLSNNNQIGDTTLLNDDIFGLLALTASGSLTGQTTKQSELTFIIQHQGSDHGFSWTTDTSCAWCGSDSNDTAAALQALQAAKDNSLTDPNLDSAIESAKAYLLSLQKSDGGFGYDAYSDSDGSSTAWALMALNSLGLKDSPEAQQARAWLIANQETDGGFHWMSGYSSDTYTTSHAVIALQGKSWLLQTFGSAPAPSPTILPSASPSPVVSPTPTPIPSSSPTPTPGITPTVTPITVASPSPAPLAKRVVSKPTVKPQILGETTKEEQASQSSPLPPNTIEPPTANQLVNSTVHKNTNSMGLTIVAIGFVSAVVFCLKIIEKRKRK